jgi:hypothetical protein
VTFALLAVELIQIKRARIQALQWARTGMGLSLTK